MTPTFPQKGGVIAVVVVLGLGLVLGPTKSDPDPLQDYCIADTKTKGWERNKLMNGEPCINPELAAVSHFSTSALSRAGNSSGNPFGFRVTPTTTENLPGMNTMGLSLSRVDIGPNGLVPLHSHPRASEVATLLVGALLVGFVDSSNRLFTQQLRPGDSFVFPKGMLHFLYNLQRSDNSLVISGLNSQSPGTQITSMAAFATDPALPDDVLQIAFQIGGQDVARIRKKLGGGA